MPLFQQDPQVQATAVGDRVVLFHRHTQVTTILNPTGSRLWELLGAPLSVADLADALQDTHDSLTPERAGVDASTFLDSLLAHALVIRHG
ncbi:MAG: PqqD family protein [Synechococcaceae cyanobacterium ELA263]